MSIDNAFVGLPETPTFNVWRIEEFKPVPWPDFGSFCTGDSYIVLSAVFAGSSQRVKRDIYFWIGAGSSQDEYGSAAILTVQLDDRFQGEPIQHREVQYHESDGFFRLFTPYGGIRYLEGGVASGFRSAANLASTQLYRVKGNRNPVLSQVPAVGTSLNQGDAFILTSPKALFLWIGSGANVREKQKASVIIDFLKPKFKGVPVNRLEGGETTPEFWGLLGGETPIAPAIAGGTDQEIEAASVRKIYKADGGNFALIAEGAAAVQGVLGEGIFVIQRGETIVVYLSKAFFGEKKNAIQLGVTFLGALGLPNYYSIEVARAGIASDALAIVFA
jgi:gelsolin